MRRWLLFWILLVAGTSFAQTKEYIVRDHRFFISEPIPDQVLSRMAGNTLPKGAAIRIEDLRYLTLHYYDFDGQVRKGEMICNQEIAYDLLMIFSELFHRHYPFYSICLVDDFGGSDEASMMANNTSCFNYRNIKGTQLLSKHAYGMAVDVNPLQNPWIRGKNIYPPSGAEYADRTREFPHKIDKDDDCYQLFKAKGFLWGGEWKRGKDYQHFYKQCSP